MCVPALTSRRRVVPELVPTRQLFRLSLSKKACQDPPIHMEE